MGDIVKGIFSFFVFMLEFLFFWAVAAVYVPELAFGILVVILVLTVIFASLFAMADFVLGK